MMITGIPKRAAATSVSHNAPQGQVIPRCGNWQTGDDPAHRENPQDFRRTFENVNDSLKRKLGGNGMPLGDSKHPFSGKVGEVVKKRGRYRIGDEHAGGSGEFIPFQKRCQEHGGHRVAHEIGGHPHEQAQGKTQGNLLRSAPQAHESDPNPLDFSFDTRGGRISHGAFIAPTR